MDLTPAVIGIIVGLLICVVALVIVLVVFFTGRNPLVEGNVLIRPIDCSPKYRCVGKVGYMNGAEERHWRQQRLNTQGLNIINPVRPRIYLPDSPIVTLPPPTPPRPEATFFPASPSPPVRRQVIERNPAFDSEELVYLPNPSSPGRNLPRTSVQQTMVYDNGAFDNQHSWHNEDDEINQYRQVNQQLQRRGQFSSQMEQEVSSSDEEPEQEIRVIHQTPAIQQAMPIVRNFAPSQQMTVPTVVQQTNLPASIQVPPNLTSHFAIHQHAVQASPCPVHQHATPAHQESSAVYGASQGIQSSGGAVVTGEAGFPVMATPAFMTGPTTFFAAQHRGPTDYEEQEQHTGMFERL